MEEGESGKRRTSRSWLGRGKGGGGAVQSAPGRRQTKAGLYGMVGVTCMVPYCIAVEKFRKMVGDEAKKAVKSQRTSDFVRHVEVFALCHTLVLTCGYSH